eukprot:7603514-Pyramimonas_sp.AAC.1
MEGAWVTFETLEARSSTSTHSEYFSPLPPDPVWKEAVRIRAAAPRTAALAVVICLQVLCPCWHRAPAPSIPLGWNHST